MAVVVVVAGFAVAVVVVVVVVAGFAVVLHNTPCPRISEVRKVFEQLASITTSIELRSQKKII